MGQSRDPSALAVVERAEIVLDDIDYVTYERRRAWRWRALFLERMVVERVRQCELAMDATGLGMPVLDMLRAAGLGCRITPVGRGTVPSTESTMCRSGI